MRTIRFRDILWSVAYKMNLDPADPNADFQSNEADSMASAANQWVRRLWDSQDWPEWTFIEPRTPDANHIVPYSTNGTGTHTIGTIRKVFLADPITNSGRELDTHFELFAQGIHCGFEHGPMVWIKFLPPCPQYSADLWMPGNTYRQGALVYSGTGDTYKSKSSGNIGNAPGFEPTPLVTTVNQVFVPAVSPTPGTNAQIKFLIQPPALVVAGAIYTIVLRDEVGMDHSFAYTLGASPTIDSTLNGLIAAAAASSDPWVNSLIVTKDTPTAYLFIEKNAFFQSFGISNATAGTITIPLLGNQLQYFQAGSPGSPSIPQITNVSLPNPLITSALYEIILIDANNGQHVIAYDSVGSDGVTEILNGLMANFNASADPWFDDVTLVPDFTFARLTISTLENVAVNAEVVTPNSPWWELVPFPFALADSVIRGILSDQLKEDGQTDKGMAEEQLVPTEVTVRSTSIQTAEESDPLTTQPLTKERYQS